MDLNLLSANPTKWSNTFKQFVYNLPTNVLNVLTFCRVGTFKGLTHFMPMFLLFQCFENIKINSDLGKKCIQQK